MLHFCMNSAIMHRLPHDLQCRFIACHVFMDAQYSVAILMSATVQQVLHGTGILPLWVSQEAWFCCGSASHIEQLQHHGEAAIALHCFTCIGLLGMTRALIVCFGLWVVPFCC